MRNKNISGARRPKKYIVSNVVFIIIGIIMAAYIVSLVIPILWTIMASFKDIYDFSQNPFSFPDTIEWGNYSYAFSQLQVEVWIYSTQKLVSYNYFNMFLYSMIYSVGTTVMGLFMNYLTAYPVAKYKFFGRKFLYNFAIVMMIIPVVGNLSASLYVRKVLHIYDNLWLHILTASGGFGFNFVLLYGAIKRLSWSYAESAFLDGAGHFTVMFRIYLPMIMPLMLGLFMLGFTGSWNDYSTILTYLPSTPNLAYGVFTFDQFAVAKRHTTPQILAAFMLLAIPTVILWSITQRFVMSSMVVGGLKE